VNDLQASTNAASSIAAVNQAAEESKLRPAQGVDHRNS
jgi:hypothetical protein